MRLFDIITYTY